MSILKAGQNIGPYRVIEQVGQGGMASVYKAYHAAMDRYVAIKVLPFQFFQNEEFRARFRHEVKVIASLEHPYILPVYDSGEDNDMPYLVMRYLETGSLKRRLQDGRMTIDAIDPVFTQLATALGYAHERDVIHRDIKPANILIDRRGDIFLTDFGIAKLVGDTAEFTASGAITGTPAYMSPEQAQGYPLDPRSDIYSLGIILYELVTGQVPYEAETPLAVILKHLQEPLPLPTEIDPTIPAPIERVILKALAKDREDRFVSTQDFMQAWKQAIGQGAAPSASVPYMPPTVIERSPLEAELTDALTADTVLDQESAVSAPAAQPMPAVQQAPAPRNRLPRWLLPAGITAALLLCIVAIAAGGYVLLQNPPALPAPATEIGQESVDPTAVQNFDDTVDPTEPAESGSEQEPDSATEEEPPVEPVMLISPEGWTSWTGTAEVYDLVIYDDQLLAGGPNGVAVYALDGELVDQWTFADGLPDVWINDLFVDQDGSLWLATDGGLVHQDGDSAQVYSYDEGISSSLVSTVVRAGDTLFAGTFWGDDNSGPHLFENGRWNPIPGFFSSYEDENLFSINITAAAAHPEGGIWIGTERFLAFYNGGDFEPITTDLGLPDNYITSLFYDDDGVLWIGTGFGLARFGGANFETVPQMSQEAIYAMHQEANGTIWFAGDGGVWSHEPASDQWEFHQPDFEENAPWSYRAIAQAEDGTLYFGSLGKGIYRFDGVFTNLQPENSPRGTRFGQITEHPEGLLFFNEPYWIATDIYSRFTDEWLPASAFLENLPCCVQPIAFDFNGRLWGGGDTGLWIYDFTNAVNLTTRHGLPDDIVTDIAFNEDQSLAFVATPGGLAVIENEQVIEVVEHGMTGSPEEGPMKVFVQSNGDLWLIYHEGVAVLRGDGWDYFGKGQVFGDDLYQVTDIDEGNDGVIWVATDGDGLYCYKDGSWSNYLPTDPDVMLPSWTLFGVAVAPDGGVWIATDWGGAVFFEGQWQVFDVDHGLIHPYINDIYITADGEVWFSTFGGLSRWIP
jgi:serine/threonine-protein kinase